MGDLMSDVTPQLFSDGCNNELPAWGVTRQYEFGQFVILYDERNINGKRVTTPIVLTNEGDIEVAVTKSASNQAVIEKTGGVPLQLLYESDKAVELIRAKKPLEIKVDDVVKVMEQGTIPANQQTFAVDLSAEAKLMLAFGQPVTVLAKRTLADKQETLELVRLTPAVEEVVVNKANANSVFSQGKLKLGRQTLAVKFEPEIVERLLQHEQVIVPGKDSKGKIKLIQVNLQQDQQPLSVTPAVRSNVSMDVREWIERMKSKLPAEIRKFLDDYFHIENGGLTKQVSPGLQIAILLPWQQEWTLEGFTRGNLISTIALAPGEETTIQISSWESRTKSLEQSSETEVEQNIDFNQTTRDTEDVVREITNRNDFQAQVQANLDASYTNGVATVKIGTNGGVTNTNNLSSVLKTTQNHFKEVTQKASTRVRSKRITKISEYVESGFSQQVTRKIQNPNECRTLTLDFHETLAHYKIATRFVSSRVRLVVLVPNPLSLVQFNSLTVRKNESALYNGLLDRSLVDGLDACRLLSSYEFAKDELKSMYEQNKKVKEQNTERVEKNEPKKPVNPYEKTVLDVYGTVISTAKTLFAAQILPALKAIGSHNSVTDTLRNAGQQWLYVKLCQKHINPAFMSTLSDLSKSSSIQLKDVQTLLDTVPGLDAYPSLTSLNELTDEKKEQSGLDVLIKQQPDYDFLDWGWWTGRCREERLYQANDAGLASQIKRLKDEWSNYQSKAAEGTGVMEGNQMVDQAMGSQNEANYMDKLEMKYGLDVISSARERQQALLAHLNDHADYYRYVLFQALPPGEQLRLLMMNAQQLQVGMFEPHVVAMNGKYLAIPLTPIGQSKLETTLSTLQVSLQQASEEADEAASAMGDDKVILPTPGITIESRLGKCSGCEDHVEKLREAEARKAAAEASLLELEVARLQARLNANPPLLEDNHPAAPALRIQLDSEN